MSSVLDRAVDPAASPRRRPDGASAAAPRASGPRTPGCRRRRRGARRRSPFAGTGELADFADDQIALDAAKAVDEDRAVEVIHLVLKGAGQQAGALVLERLPLAIERLDDRAHRPHDGGVEAGHAEAPFLFELRAVALDEL